MPRQWGSSSTPQVTFAPDGVWIYDGTSKPYWFAGSPLDLVNVMVYHRDMEISTVRFRVIGRMADTRFMGDLG